MIGDQFTARDVRRAYRVDELRYGLRCRRLPRINCTDGLVGGLVTDRCAMGEDHAQCEENIGKCRPGDFAGLLIGSVADLLQVVHDLPDPGRYRDTAPQKGQRRVKEYPATAFERGPACLRVGYRLAVSLSDDRLHIGLVQRCQNIAFDDVGAQRDGPGHINEGQRVNHYLWNDPHRGKPCRKHILAEVESHAIG